MNITANLQRHFQERGAVLYLRYIDKNPEKGLLGVRVLNVEQMLEGAEAVSIFDRSTCTLTYRGWGNDQTVRLDGDEGRAMLEYIRAEKAWMLPDDVWNQVPETADGWAEMEAVSTSKHELVLYLQEWRPDIFGPLVDDGGNASPDIERTLLALLKQDEQFQDTVRASRLMLIRRLEGAAIDLYRQANGLARAAAVTKPGTERKMLLLRALGLCHCAATMREMIRVTAQPYPDLELAPMGGAIPAKDLLRWEAEVLGVEVNPEVLEAEETDAAAANNSALNVLEQPTDATQPETGVTVKDPNHIHYRRIGYILRPADNDPQHDCFVVLLGTDGEWPMKFSQLGIIR